LKLGKKSAWVAERLAALQTRRLNCLAVAMELDFRCDRDDVHVVALGLDEFDDAIAECEEREIASEADIFSGVEFCSALAYDDATGRDSLAAVCLYAAVLRIAVASVTT
jgi:hypothetical protein